VVALQQQYRLPARTTVDATVAGTVAAGVARAAGLDRRVGTEIGISASELASNIVRHAYGRGYLDVVVCASGVELVASDEGPGDVERVRRALARGRASLRPGMVGLGGGVAAVGRLMDEVSVTDRVGGGLEVRALRRWPTERCWHR
jgi:serine/threonine-protein kinase RsbT